MKTPELILNAAIGVLQRSGRCFGDFVKGGKHCVLGAVAVAAGKPPHVWWALQEAQAENRLKASDRVLIQAAQCLARVVARDADLDDLDDVCCKIGAWHDGGYGEQPSDDDVYDALRVAARLAAQAAVVSA